MEPKPDIFPRLLVIESNEALRTVLARSLAKQPYRPAFAASQAEGLQLLRRSPEPFALVLTAMHFDFSRNALDYLKEMWEARSGALVIVMSAGLRTAAEAEWMEQRHIPFLSKPFGLQELFDLLASVENFIAHPPTPQRGFQLGAN